MRAGAQTLLLLASPLNAQILRSLAAGPKQQAKLQREAGSPAQTTLRAQLKRLATVGGVEKRRLNRFPGVLEYELTARGRELLSVTSVLERWLDAAPAGRLRLGESAARAAIKALADGWTTTMLRALAARPLTLTELDNVIGSFSYPALERRLAAMRLACLVEPDPGPGRGTPYTVTEWAREAVAALLVAARWEQQRIPEAPTSASPLDIETVFMLSLPLLRLSSVTSCSCHLVVEAASERRGTAGITFRVRAGKVADCIAQAGDGADTWANGSTSAWLAALVEGDLGKLELGGNSMLARTLIEGLRGRLLADKISRSFARP